MALCCGPGPVPVVSQKIAARQGYLRGTGTPEVLKDPVFSLMSTCLLLAFVKHFKVGVTWPACKACELRMLFTFVVFKKKKAHQD